MNTRRDFMKKSLATCLAFQGARAFKPSRLSAAPRMLKDDISLAQWALVDEIREGKWKTLDFAGIARKEFGINGIEFVNTLFESPTHEYLKQLKENASAHGVTMVLIMVDDEGETCTPSKEERKLTVINHRKWIDAANFLGCHAIRTNCRGPQDADKQEALKWASDTYHQMLEYAVPANVGICIENHGGVSNDADWMVALMKRVNDRHFGTYPDWRSPSAQFDNYAYLQKVLPWAMGMSYRNQPDEETSRKMIRLCHDSGYRGWYGIESSGRVAIREGKRILEKYLLNS
jgi:L-ribulose-5-phosphate 3-epimerase